MSQVGYNPETRERTTVAWNGTGDMPEALARAQSQHPVPYDPRAPSQASNGMIVTVNEDGSVDIEHPAPAIRRVRSADDFHENLAENMDDGALSGISQDYLDGVEADIMSRSGFIANYNKGIDLLGLKIEDSSGTRGARTSISRTKHPALLKACVRSQSNARGQLLPAAGPAKIQTIGDSTGQEDTLARDFEDDFNFYLTDVAREFYPDTDRALFYRAFGGSMYKKVYRCPLRRRPVSEFVSLESLIVSEDISDLHSATRKTNEIVMPPALMKRMQLRGGWRDVALSIPQQNLNPARRKILESQGFSAVTTRPQDMDFTVYEGYWNIDPRDYGFDEPNAPEGLPLPYRVVIDRDSRQVLALHRNWRRGDEDFLERPVFVKYGLVPGLGFLDYGFLHLIGNQTRVLTAAWQILVDNGMLKNFPGGLKVRGVRTSTNEINPNLGEWVEVDIGAADDIRKALMGMPYGDISPQFMALIASIEEDVERLSGTIEIETGSNRTNMPVGTILAMIEQQAQDLTAVHQRDHRSQKEELRLMRDLFLEHPEDLKWMQRKGSDRKWSELVAEFSDMNLVPASDPNVPSQTHRIMLNMFLMQLAQGAPMLFGSKIRQVAERILTSVGIADADSLLASPQEIAQAQAAMSQPKGGQGGQGQASLAKTQLELPLRQQQVAIDAQRLQLEQQESQREAANEAEEHRQRDEDQAAKTQKDQLDARLAVARLASEHVRDMASSVLENAMSPQDEANLRKTNAQAFSAMGQGAMGFAKAGEAVRQGEADLAGLDSDLSEEGSARRLQRPSRQRRNRAAKQGQE